MIARIISRLPLALLRLRYLHRSINRGSVGLGDGRVLTRTIFGHKLLLDARDQSLVPHLIMDGFWELAITRHVRRRVRRGMTIVEVGANIGYFTTLMAGRVGNGGLVIACEANPEVFALLRDNVNLNGFRERCRLHALAAVDVEGQVTFHVLEKLHGSGCLAGFDQVLLDQFGDRSRPITVPAARLDDLVGDRRVDLIRMDAEGSEPRIIAGAWRLVQDHRPGVITEYSPVMIKRSGGDPGAFLDRFTAIGYRIRLIDAGGALQPVSRDHLLGLAHCDIDLALS